MKLKETKVTSAQRIYSLKHILTLTVIDSKGRVCTKNFNNLDEIEDMNEDSLKFCLSVLHARSHLFESLLHLAYKLPVKRW